MRPQLPYTPQGSEPGGMTTRAVLEALAVYGRGTNIDALHFAIFCCLSWGYPNAIKLFRAACIPESGVGGSDQFGVPDAGVPMAPATPPVSPSAPSPARASQWRAFLCSPILGAALAMGGFAASDPRARLAIAALNALRAYTCSGQPLPEGQSESGLRDQVCALARQSPASVASIPRIGPLLLAACNLGAQNDTNAPALPAPDNAGDIISAAYAPRSFRSVPQLAAGLRALNDLGYSAEDGVDDALASGLLSNADELLYAVIAGAIMNASTFGQLVSYITMSPVSSIPGLTATDAATPAAAEAKSFALSALKSLFSDGAPPLMGDAAGTSSQGYDQSMGRSDSGTGGGGALDELVGLFQ